MGKHPKGKASVTKKVRRWKVINFHINNEVVVKAYYDFFCFYDDSRSFLWLKNLNKSIQNLLQK